MLITINQLFTPYFLPVGSVNHSTHIMTFTPREDSDQPGHLSSLITLRCFFFFFFFFFCIRRQRVETVHARIQKVLSVGSNFDNVFFFFFFFLVDEGRRERLSYTTIIGPSSATSKMPSFKWRFAGVTFMDQR